MLSLKTVLGATGLLVLVAVIYFAFQHTASDPSDDPLAKIELDPEKQKKIWNAEHITFEIERRFGKACLALLSAKEKEKLRAFFRNHFQGSTLAKSTAREKKHGLVTQITRARLPDAPITNSPDEIIDALLNRLTPFKSIQRSNLRVLTIQEKGSDQWQARLLLTFFGLDEKNNPINLSSEHEILCTIHNELEIDKVAMIDRWTVESDSLQQSNGYLMEDITEQVNLHKVAIPDNWTLPVKETRQYRFQVAVEDFNRDGFLDIAVSVHNGRPVLLQSLAGKKFKDVTKAMGIAPHQPLRPFDDLLAAWIDYDNNGYPDLILGNRLYRNENGKQFKDVTRNSGLRIESECMGAVVADYDCDGLLDLYLLYQKPHDEKEKTDAREQWVNEQETGKENQLWKNLGNGRFKNVTHMAGAGGGKRHTHAAAWFFYDSDHYPDLYLANDFGRNVILRNNGNGTFQDVSESSGASGYATSMGVATGDVDNDGLTDIYVANMYSKMGRRIIGQVTEADYPKGIYDQIRGSCAGNRLYLCQKSSGPYKDHSEALHVNAVGWAYAPAMVDLDGDGWLDLYATTGFMSFEPDEPDG